MIRIVRAEGTRIEYVLIQAVRRDVLIQALEGDKIRVYAPKTAHLRDVDELVRQNAARILEMRAAIKPATIENGAIIRVEGAPKTLVIEKGQTQTQIDGDVVKVICPDPTDGAAARMQLRAYLAEMALGRIRERIAYYLPLIGGKMGRVTVRDQRTRWGSCSSKHNLNFNWKLILAPPECLDYVVIHELCHLTEFNHSPRFWNMVELQMPDYRVWKDYLKKNGARLGF